MIIAFSMTRRRTPFACVGGVDEGCCAANTQPGTSARRSSTNMRRRLLSAFTVNDTLTGMAQTPLAYLNPDFLDSEEARPIRILSEYLEPLGRFKEQRIQDTVVFFGSARDADAAYEKELHKTRKAVEWARFYEEARELARLLTSWSLTLSSANHRFVVT